MNALLIASIGVRCSRAAGSLMVGALMLAASASASSAQENERLGAKLDAGTRAAVLQTLEAARASGLPTDPLIDKALEGATKRAPASRIEAAVEAMLQRLRQSRDALAPAPGDRDIAAGADALAFGVPLDALRSMRAIRPRGSVAVPLAVLTQLVASGVPVPRATVMVSDLIRRGARDEQLIALSDDVRWDVAAGASPEAALDVRTRGLTAVLPAAPGAATNAGDLMTSAPGNNPQPRKP